MYLHYIPLLVGTSRIYYMMIWCLDFSTFKATLMGIKIKYPLRECSWCVVIGKCNQAMSYWVPLYLRWQPRCLQCVYSSWPHTCTYRTGRAVRESDTALKSSIDLIMSCTLNRKSPLGYAFTPLYWKYTQTGSETFNGMPGRCVFPSQACLE